MKANDLRIGNFVFAGGHLIQKVRSINKFTIKLQWTEGQGTKYPIEKIEGIPLTEEWLTKLGFKRDGNELAVCYIKEGFLPILLDDDSFSLCDIDIYVQFDFVHELQNCYYTLTDKDLELIK